MTQRKRKKQVRISEIIIPKYQKIFNNTKIKHIILTSGRAGTKSSYAAIRADFQILADPHGSVVVLRKHHNKLRKTVYKEMLRGINRLEVPKTAFKITKSPMEITYKKHGTTIYFSGSDGIDDTKGIIDEDKPIKLVILDELTEFFDDGEGEDELTNIEATFVRGNSSGFQMIYLYNPPKNPNAEINQWCKKMEKRSDCIHIHTDYRDVPAGWLGQDLIDSAEEMLKTDPKMYRWVWLGEPTGVEDLIYYMFTPQDHIYNPSEYGKESKEAIGEIGIGVDYGQQNATVFEAAGIDYENQILRGLKEYYHSGREAGKQKSPSDYAKDLKQFCDELEKEYNRVVSYIFIDPSAAGLIEEVRRQLPHISIISARNDVKLGISRVQKFLSLKKIKISASQKYLIKEMGIYQYDPKSIENGKEVPLKVNDHAQDAWRYLVVGMWKQIIYMLPMSERGDED
ncbi:MAG: PBSX family phage terminase large subunit [Lachnospiraceae bacterium]